MRNAKKTKDNTGRDSRGRFTAGNKYGARGNHTARAMSLKDDLFDFENMFRATDFNKVFNQLSPKEKMWLYCKILDKLIPSNLDITDNSIALSEEQFMEELAKITGGFLGVKK